MRPNRGAVPINRQVILELPKRNCEGMSRRKERAARGHSTHRELDEEGAGKGGIEKEASDDSRNQNLPTTKRTALGSNTQEILITLAREKKAQ